MDLPHSVKEMAKEDFMPQRCASTTFPGFSFILDDFDIPDKAVSFFMQMSLVEI